MNRRQRIERKKEKALQDRSRREKKASMTAVQPGQGSTATLAPIAATATGTVKFSIELPLDNFFLAKEAREWLDTLLAGTEENWLIKILWDAAIPNHLILNAPTCRKVLVSAEMIAAMRGRHSKFLPLRAAQWIVKDNALVSPGLVAFAADAVRRVADFSELRILVEASGLKEKWMPGIEDLHRRLQPKPTTESSTNPFGFEESNLSAKTTQRIRSDHDLPPNDG